MSTIFQNHTALSTLSEMLIQGNIISKYDLIAVIHIHGYHHFNIYRRYNSSYEIIIEDYVGDFHFHQNQTIYESLRSLLCFSDIQMATTYVTQVIYIRDFSSPFAENLLHLRWTDIQEHFSAAIIHIGFSDSSLHTFIMDEFVDEDNEADAGEDEVDSVC